VGTVFALQAVGIAIVIVVGVLILLWRVLVLVWNLLQLRVEPIRSLIEVLGGLIAGLVMRDRWGEVFDTIRRNKLRTILTAFSVAWGIFVLIVLLGLGHGLNNGVRQSFRRQATNAIYLTANKTSVPHAGYGIGRRITFDNSDYENAKTVEGVDRLSGQYFIRGGRFGGGEMKVQRGVKSNAFQVNAVHPDAFYLSGHDIIQGRFVNQTDVATLRKVCVIGRPARDYLFGSDERGPDGGEIDPIGQWINIGTVAFEVVGVFSDEAGQENERQIYVPVSTAQLAFHGSDNLGMLMLTVGDADVQQSKAIADELVGQLASAHQFSRDDKQAVRAFNTVEGSQQFKMVFFAISAFVVLIGCGTLLAGVVGVSNIMMIAVKERTREIGIRKALGATPSSIVAMIVQEAIFLTAIAGLFGLVFGVLALEVIPRVVDTDMIRNPSVDIQVGVLAAIGLAFAGALAGFVPARTAARVNPIHTLRDQ
jgi:putative ABC transport system permease protein